MFTGAKCFGGPVRYVMAGSGHIAGVVNPPAKPKYQYWTGGPPEGEFEDWVAAAKETPGSWWPDWVAVGHGAGARESPRPQARRRQAESRSATRRGRLAFDVAEVAKAGEEFALVAWVGGGSEAEVSDPREGKAAAQRAPGSAKRPRRRQGRGTHAASFDHLVGAGEQHLGISMPSALAVLRLMANLIAVACSIGRSPGFAPLRMRST